MKATPGCAGAALCCCGGVIDFWKPLSAYQTWKELMNRSVSVAEWAALLTMINW